MNSYLSHLDYIRAATGQETASLIGNSMLLAAPRAAGVSTLPLVNATVANLDPSNPITIFDGSSSEVVYVAAATPSGALSIPIQAPGLSFSHGQYTAMCSDGISGSLGQAIMDASDILENICKQSLLSATYTETYALQTMQASVDTIGTLTLRTPHKPVTAFVSAALTNDETTTQALSGVVKLNGQLISIVNVGLPRNTQGYVDVTFTAGFQYAAMPNRVKQAAIWIVSDLLTDRLNPAGAAVEGQGKIHTQYRLLHETRSMMYLRAEEALKEYTVKVY